MICDVIHSSPPFAMRPAPFDGDEVLEGSMPIAHYAELSCSADGMAAMYVWECSPGKFNCFYNWDETIYVLEGAVALDRGLPSERYIQAGDIVFFPAGTQVQWDIQTYVRKLAFRRRALPAPLSFLARILRTVKNLVLKPLGGDYEVSGIKL